ncbi:MAG: hypothetical protein ACKESC_00970 [Candidatus Hodgkinia cicadicola]
MIFIINNRSVMLIKAKLNTLHYWKGKAEHGCIHLECLQPLRGVGGLFIK